MAGYELALKPSVEKDLAKLSTEIAARVIRRMEMLEQHPLPRQALKLEGSEHLYRVRVGGYRIIYSFDASRKQIAVHYVRHRREAYRRLG
jgi:mRNA interferase RelE/StbE